MTYRAVNIMKAVLVILFLFPYYFSGQFIFLLFFLILFPLTLFIDHSVKKYFVIILNAFSSKKLSKNITDAKSDILSTSWDTISQGCSSCESYCGHQEYMADACNNCGEHGTVERFLYSYRYVFHEGEWKEQRKYKAYGKRGYSLVNLKTGKKEEI